MESDAVSFGSVRKVFPADRGPLEYRVSLSRSKDPPGRPVYTCDNDKLDGRGFSPIGDNRTLGTHAGTPQKGGDLSSSDPALVALRYHEVILNFSRATECVARETSGSL